MLQYMGTGTQRVVDYLAGAIPGLRLLRLDLDSTVKAGSHSEILRTFQSGQADVLVGTQMVSKGFDFPAVTLSAVLHIDGILNLPDYTSSERAFQLLVQTAGRAGRGETPGQVLLQTFNPANPILKLAENHDYLAFYRNESALRKALDYPPYKKCARLLVTGLVDEDVEARLVAIMEHCKRALSDAEKEAITWLGPVKAPLERINNRWRRHVVLLADGWALLAKALNLARSYVYECTPDKNLEPKTIFDMDAKSLL